MNDVRKMIYDNMCKELVSADRLCADGSINSNELHDILVGKKVPTLLFIDVIAKQTGWEDMCDFINRKKSEFEEYTGLQVDFNAMSQSDIIQLYSWEQSNPEMVSMKDKYKPVYDENLYTVTNYLIEVAHMKNKSSIKTPTKAVVEAVLDTVPKCLMEVVLSSMRDANINFAEIVTPEMVVNNYRAVREEFSVTRNELVQLLELTNGIANRYEAGTQKPTAEEAQQVATYINNKIAAK